MQHRHHLRGHLRPQQELQSSSCPEAPDPSDLVTISQSRCSPSDLLRMQAILADKLGLVVPDIDDDDDVSPVGSCTCPHEPAVTPLRLLRLMFSASRAAAVRLGLPDLLPISLPDNLVHKLEILVCDSLTLAHRYYYTTRARGEGRIFERSDHNVYWIFFFKAV